MMWPRNGFTSCEARNDRVAEREERFRVAGRDVAAIAFVHAAARRSDLPPCALRELRDDELERATDLLLQSGNPEPALAYAGPAAFLDALRTREHRGALALTQPNLWLNGDGIPVRVSFRMLDARIGAGYTPKPDGGATNGNRARSYAHGVGSVSDRGRNRVRFSEDAVEVVHWQRFQLPSPAQLYGRFPRAAHAPYGWIKISYLLRADGSAQAHLASSYLPSVWFYRDFRREFARDMLDAGELEIERFLMPDKEIPSGSTWLAMDASSSYVHAIQ